MANPVRESSWLAYHLVPTEEWDAVSPGAPYTPAAFPQGGFIHTTHTAVEVAAAGNRYYARDTRPYYVVVIDLRRLISPWRYDGDARFPHIYSPLNREAVIAAPPAPRASDGAFLPPTWADPLPAPGDLITPKIGANAAVFDDRGRILLVQREDNRLWCLPSGHVELGETIAAAVVRETEEESGIVVEPGRVVGIYSDPHAGLRIGFGLRYHIVSMVIACRPTGGALRPSDETPDVGWFDPDTLPPCVPSHYQRIADARAGGETVLA